MRRGVLLDVPTMARVLGESENAIYKKAADLPGYVRVRGRVKFRLVDLIQCGWVPADWLPDAREVLSDPSKS